MNAILSSRYNEVSVMIRTTLKVVTGKMGSVGVGVVGIAELLGKHCRPVYI